MSVKTYAKANSVELSENFSSHEFNCHGDGCCSQTLIDPNLALILQKIRTHFGVKVIITSGYRCPTHNRSIGSGTSSYHAKGMAADITVEGVAPREVAKYAESIGVLGIGLYETSADGYFVHIDTRTRKYFWYGQSQAYRSTFGGTPVAVTPPTESQTPATQILMLRGSKGIQVKAMQEKLIALGYDLGVHGADGDFGQMTDIAVRSFQAANGLVEDGKAGQKTLDALDNAYEKADKTIVNNGFKVKILASVLYVRSGAGMNYPIIGKVKRNSVQTILEEKDGWGRIANGWISSSYYQKL